MFLGHFWEFLGDFFEGYFGQYFMNILGGWEMFWEKIRGGGFEFFRVFFWIFSEIFYIFLTN